MPEYKCSICDYKSDYKTHMKDHINRKVKCGEGILELIEVKLDFECNYCKKTFSNKTNLGRHFKTCKTKKNNLEEENEKLKREVEILKELVKKPTIGTQNNININLAPWNNPLLPDDVEKYYREAVKKIFLAIPTLIKYIHFNTEHPENHNICIENGRPL